ncbi:MAG: lipocalin family protein [Flavobacterium sp.]|uniref:lipocalin family protein n=1 Tax=Flavobacterium sp. TaxID=239 RepID=UPI0022C922E2|nr:lipocalin family protein [Flavobacterium sp.]MCZ8196101.1 lipocalin family protein [Flavobacterium sp.]
MKNLKSLVLLFLVATVSLVSCNKDDDATPAAAALEGKWQYSKQGTIVNGQEVLVDYDHATGCTKDYIEFLSAGVFKEHSFFGTSCEEDIFTGTWVRNGSTVTATVDGEASPAEILELTSTTLKIKYSLEGGFYINVYTKI